MIIHLGRKVPGFLRANCSRRARRNPGTDLCTAPIEVEGSPLQSELQALHDHASRLGWLTAREHRPDLYRQLAAEAISMLLDGWRAQRTGGTLADLTGQLPHE